jgi:hypothetical protein
MNFDVSVHLSNFDAVVLFINCAIVFSLKL